MSSILTNNGATVALQTLRAINTELSTVQTEIATGRKVSRANDNAAIWAISKTMEADVRGFKGVSESLSLGQATVSVARQGAETITELMTEIKGKVVAAQEENVDRSKIQADIEALVDQVDSIVSSASFNGMNLLQNTDTEAGSGTSNILASIDRKGTEVVNSDISIRKRDLSTSASTVTASGGTYNAAAVTGTLNATQEVDLDLSGLTVDAGAAFSLSIYGTDGNDSSFVEADYQSTAGTNETRAEMVAGDMTYVAREGDTASDVAAALVRKFNTYSAENGLDSNVLSMTASGGTITINSTVTDGTDVLAVNVNELTSDAGNTIGGGLEDLRGIDVTTDSGADAAMASIEGLIDVGIDTAAAFGSDERRLDTQQDFISGLTDALRSGIGALVDADMEESSAKLQALQVQQQLAMQSLAIANSSPQSLLSLFR